MKEQQDQNKFDESITDFLDTIKDNIKVFNKTNYRELNYFISLIPEAISYKLVPILYESNIKFRKNYLSLKKKIGYRILNTNQKLNYMFWFILFKIKWLLLFRKIDTKNKIIVNVGCERKISQFYLEAINELAIKNKTIIISFNILCSFKYLFNTNYFYYHSFNLVKSYDKSILENLSTIIYSKIQKFDEYFSNRKNIQQNIYENLIFLNREFLKCKRFLSKNKNTIVGLVQDYDYSYNKYLYVKQFKRNKLKTISLQHSIIFYHHLYKKIFSDHYFVWGKQELQKARQNNKLTDIEVIGYPFKNNGNIKMESRKKFVLFFLASHDYATSQSDNRQLEYVNSISQQINKSLKIIDPYIEYIVVPHPNDRKKLYDSFTVLSSKNNIRKYLKKTKLLIFEDTTAIFDYMLSCIPILYICDENNNDPLQIKRFKSISIFYNGEDMKEALLKSLETKVDLKKREKHLSYFLKTATKSNYSKAIEIKLYNK